MQLKSILVIALAAVCCGTASAQKKGGKKSKSKNTAKVTAAAPALKPVDGTTFSYALGVAQGQSLKQYLIQREGVDSAYVSYALEGMQANVSETERKQREAYAAGLRIADMNKRTLPMFNKQAAGKEDTTYVSQSDFQRGLCDAVAAKAGILSADSARSIVDQQINYQRATYKAANEKWLADNKKLKGVKTLPSGLQYRVLTEGNGPVATDSTEVDVHYRGQLIDGTEFDSSYKRNKPATFRPDQVIKGWREALTMMPEGSKWDLYIPAALGYGESGNPTIPGNSTLIFEVEVVKVKAKDTAAKSAATPAAKLTPATKK